jgi:hypothetical protein
MNEEDYILIQTQLVVLAQIVNSMDLKGFIEAINRAETMGPILDPSLYLKGADKLEAIKNLAVGALSFQSKVRQQAEEARHL